MNEQDNEKEEKKKFKDIVEKIKSDPQKKAWVVLTGYFIFFLVVVLMVRSLPTNNNSNNYNNINGINISNIKKNNYHFKYSVNIDRNIIVYEGETNNNKTLFYKSINGATENYYKENDTYYMKINNIWTTSTNPYSLSNFIDIETIEKILKESKYISKTEYNDHTRKYNYQISTTTLVKLIDNEIVDLDDMPNDIFITTDSYNRVQKIEFNLSSYTNYKLLSTINSNIVLEYSKFNEISDINVELN